ncbi:MAG TPA: polyprenyl diphosphate synthase [Planctomycetota bacterium]|nr:polyprenyl diphosphate synthase [Planctomycetota bacterium]
MSGGNGASRAQPPPAHVAIIMDGNGRWAQRQGLLRVAGHRRGIESVRRVTEECARVGVSSLTLYAFSVENWKRPKSEIRVLMNLLRRFLIDERPTLRENRIRLTSIGRIGDLPPEVVAELRESERMSAAFDGMVLRLALSYGGRAEIADAVKRIAREVAAGRLSPEAIDEETVRAFLYDPVLPDPDLLIRTAGEMRFSNFLLWQASYAELYVTPVCWPEFREAELHQAFAEYRRRVRKFGGLKRVPV